MPEDFTPGCQRPPIKKPASTADSGSQEIVKEDKKKSMVQVGKPAPDFTAPAYYNGKFSNVSLSEYKGKWLLLCFYPGDFTFV
jgi:hypothetical protein